jgi:membrane-bound ClpP family serine protease
MTSTSLSGGFLILVGVFLLVLFFAKGRLSLVALTHGFAWVALGVGLLVVKHLPVATGIAGLLWLVLLVLTPWTQRRQRARLLRRSR